MHSAIYRGWVRHRRLAPRAHAFRYRLFMMYLDLEELQELFRGRWLWSASGPAPAWFRRADYLGDPREPLDQAVRGLVRRTLGREPGGPIRLLTHLRYFGYCFNPVSFYYCFDATGTVDAIVAEVTNTPWGERHAYVLDAAYAECTRGGRCFYLDKRFHISPFMPMDLAYEWRFNPPGRTLGVHMQSYRADSKIFDATLVLRRNEIAAPTLARTLAAHPFMTGKVIAAIHWQAVKLWLKRTPFYPHPGRLKPSSIPETRDEIDHRNH